MSITQHFVSVLVLGNGVVKIPSIGYWVLGANIGIVLSLTIASDRQKLTQKLTFGLTDHFI